MYRHHKTKKALFAEMVGLALDGLLGELIALFRSNADPLELLTQVTQEIVDDLNRDDAFSNIMIFMTQAYLSGEGGVRVNELIEKKLGLVAATAELIARGQAQGVCKAGAAHQLAELYFSAIQGMSVFQAAWGQHFMPPTMPVILSILLLYEKGET